MHNSFRQTVYQFLDELHPIWICPNTFVIFSYSSNPVCFLHIQLHPIYLVETFLGRASMCQGQKEMSEHCKSINQSSVWKCFLYPFNSQFFSFWLQNSFSLPSLWLGLIAHTSSDGKHTVRKKLTQWLGKMLITLSLYSMYVNICQWPTLWLDQTCISFQWM